MRIPTRLPARVLYRATPRLLVAGGLTSGRHILAPLAVIGVIVNFADDLPGASGRADTRLRCGPRPDRRGRHRPARRGRRPPRPCPRRRRLAAHGLELRAEGRRRSPGRAAGAPDAPSGRDRSGASSRPRSARLSAPSTVRPRRGAGDRRRDPGRAGGTSGAGAGDRASAEAHELVRALDPLIDPDAPLEPHPRAARTRRYVRALGSAAGARPGRTCTPVVVGSRAPCSSFGLRRAPCPRPLPPARPRVRRPQAYRPQWIAPAPASSARLERGGLLPRETVAGAGARRPVLGRPSRRSGSRLAASPRLLGGTGCELARSARRAALQPVRSILVDARQPEPRGSTAIRNRVRS